MLKIWIQVRWRVSEERIDMLRYLSADHDDVIKWKHFPRYWPFVRGIHRSSVNSPHKGHWRGALMFSSICALNKRLSKQSWGWWFEISSRSLWRHCNAKSKASYQRIPLSIYTTTFLFANVLISGWVRSVLLCNTCINDVCVKKVSYVCIQHALLNGVNSGVCSTLYQSLSAFMILTPLSQCRIYTSVNRVSVVSDNGLSPIRRKAII